jgi:hypothetical protein
MGVMEKIREDMAELFRDRLGVSVAKVGQSYQKPYDHRFDSIPYLQGQGYLSFPNYMMKVVEAHMNM